MVIELTYKWLTYAHRCWTAACAAVFVVAGGYVARQAVMERDAAAGVGAIALFGIAGWLARITYRAKQVEADEEGLVVHGLRSRCHVPYELVESVYQCLVGGFSLRGWHHPLIKVTFTERTACGRTIVFVPAAQSERWWLPSFKTHPTVAWLEERVRGRGAGLRASGSD